LSRQQHRQGVPHRPRPVPPGGIGQDAGQDRAEPGQELRLAPAPELFPLAVRLQQGLHHFTADVTLEVVMRYMRMRGELPERPDRLFVVNRHDKYLGGVDIKLPANLPPRQGITPVTERAMNIAAPGQAIVSSRQG